MTAWLAWTIIAVVSLGGGYGLYWLITLKYRRIGIWPTYKPSAITCDACPGDTTCPPCTDPVIAEAQGRLVRAARPDIFGSQTREFEEGHSE